MPVCWFLPYVLWRGSGCSDRRGTDAQSRIIWKIRVPRVLAAVIAGAGLAVSGLIMQTILNNSMASPLPEFFVYGQQYQQL
ncbi:MAG: iron chelate uptake ABC transporter family permease subunit [Oscillospiraceae bacterium]|nr:iron chelate uptake ABC transporter family permease subunit [Oscillospiraceae bacterium]